METEDDELYKLSWIEVVIWCLLYGLITFLALAGNILVIVVTLTRLRTRSITTYFILNLAIADILTALFAIPFKFQAALFQVWHLPSSLCQIVPYTETVTLSVSVFTLTASAIHEFKTVFFPKPVRLSGNNARNYRILVVSIWVVSLIVSLPHGLFHKVYTMKEGDEIIDQCFPQYGDTDWWKIYNIYLFVINYLVPMIILDTAYTMIAVRLYTSTATAEEQRTLNGGMQPQNSSNRQLVKMLIIVVLVFTLCWAPLETYLALNEVMPQINDWKYINVFFFCSHWLAMSNSCLNPIIYGVFNAKYKREFKRIFDCLRFGHFQDDKAGTKMDTDMDSCLDSNMRTNGQSIYSGPNEKPWLAMEETISEVAVPLYTDNYQSTNRSPRLLQQSLSCNGALH